MEVSQLGLGRRTPTTFRHMEKYPLRAETMPAAPVPVTVGVIWYSSFDRPERDENGLWWVGKNHNNLGHYRGGHCVCMPHDPKRDLLSWYQYYNQGREGACVGFGASRMMSLLNRKKYDARWLWEIAKDNDEWADTNSGDNEGTSVSAAMDVLRKYGHVPARSTKAAVNQKEGILVNRWATTIPHLFSVLQNEMYQRMGAIPFLNSWGKNYPQLVWVPCETWDRLMKEDGEFTMITDR